MAEREPLNLDETRQRDRSLMERVLDRSASDPTWRQQYLDDPETAMREANFPESQEMMQTRGAGREPALEGDDVAGQQFGPGGTPPGGFPPFTSLAPEYVYDMYTGTYVLVYVPQY